MKIIVFGGSGFLGSHVCDKLFAEGHEVVVYDICKPSWPISNYEMIIGDILDEVGVHMAVKGADAVFNFAGIADIGEANGRAVDTVRYNILGNTIILNACVKEKVQRYVFASSVYVYSKSGGFYRCSKQACELYIETFSETYGLDYTILRYGSLYGSRADERNAIYRFVKEALEKGSITYLGNPNAIREYIHVEDAARCSVQILSPKYANEHIILTGNQPMQVLNVFKMISEMLGKPIEFVFENDTGHGHYEITPYSFSPKVGRKLTPKLHTDFGQGMLRVIEEVYKQTHPEFSNRNGFLLKEEK